MSVVTKAELLYGVEVSPRRHQDAAALAAFLPYVDAFALSDDASIENCSVLSGCEVCKILEAEVHRSSSARQSHRHAETSGDLWRKHALRLGYFQNTAAAALQVRVVKG